MRKVDAKELFSEAQKLDFKDTLWLLDALSKRAKMLRDKVTRNALFALRPGDTVELSQGGKRLPEGIKGKVVKVKKTKALIDFEGFGEWNVPGYLLLKVLVFGETLEQRRVVDV